MGMIRGRVSVVCCLIFGLAAICIAADAPVTKTICRIDVQSTQYGAFDHLKDIRLSFSDGSTEAITLAKNDVRQSFRFSPHRTEWVTITLLTTYGDGGGGINANSAGLAEAALYEIPDSGGHPGQERLIKVPLYCIHGSDDGASDSNWSVQNIMDGRWGAPPYYPNQQWMARNVGVAGKSVWCRIDFAPVRTFLSIPVPVRPQNVTSSDTQDPRGEWGVARIVDGVWATDNSPSTQWRVADIGAPCQPRWCQLAFGMDQEVFEIDVQNSRFPGSSHIRNIKLEFSNGLTLDRRLANTDDRQTISFPPTTTKWIKVHLLDCYEKPGPSGGFAEVAVYAPKATPSPGVYDLNNDGVSDLLVCYWNSHLTAFISDTGRLPWQSHLNRDWDRYFNRSFSVGQTPPVTWNRERANWGSYTLLVDRNANCRFDDVGTDYWYQVLDVDGDGDPDIERAYRSHPELGLHIDKYFYDLDDDNRMNYIDWSGPTYGDEQAYTGKSSYIQDTAGNGFFSLVFEKEKSTFYPDLKPAWENPIAFYDLDDDGFTEQVVRATDTPWGATGTLKELEVAFDTDNDGSKSNPSSLDIQLSRLGVQNHPFDYSKYVEDFPKFRGLPEADFLFGRRLYVRHQTAKMWLPYFDAYKIGTETENLKWNSAFLLVDEDNDDVRWEEMFSPHEFTSPGVTTLDKHIGYDDHLGDRWESDDDYNGHGKLYIGKFDGRIHLYHAERAEWTIDYRALFKGSLDRPQEAPAPPDGLQYSLIRYFDTDNNGFIDRIVYGEKKVGDDGSFKVVREVNLLDFATGDDPHPDVCELFDIKTSDKLTGKQVSKWGGGRVSGLRNEAYERLKGLFAETAASRWRDALGLYHAARDAGLIGEEDSSPMPAAAMHVGENDHKAILQLTDIRVKPNFRDVLHPRKEWETYTDAFFLAESVFEEMRARLPKEKAADFSRLYYSGELEELAKEISGAKKK